MGTTGGVVDVVEDLVRMLVMDQQSSISRAENSKKNRQE
jgi:hypothetical protein